MRSGELRNNTYTMFNIFYLARLTSKTVHSRDIVTVTPDFGDRKDIGSLERRPLSFLLRSALWFVGHLKKYILYHKMTISYAYLLGRNRRHRQRRTRSLRYGYCGSPPCWWLVGRTVKWDDWLHQPMLLRATINIDIVKEKVVSAFPPLKNPRITLLGIFKASSNGNVFITCVF